MEPLSRLDWNLLPALNALLSERSVSRAARRLMVSQPAASGALARLRRLFDDELLVRRGNSYELTPLADRLLPLASAAVASTRAVLESTTAFDQTTCEREFTVVLSDYGQLVLGPTLIERAAAAAPRVRLRLLTSPLVTAEAEALQPAIGDTARLLSVVDGWVAPTDAVRGFPSAGEVSDRWVCAVWAGNPLSRQSLTVDDLRTASWVGFTLPGLGKIPILRPLLAHGLDPRVAVVTDSFASIPFLVSGTNRLALVQERLGRRLAAAADVRLLECPLELPPLTLTMWWHSDLAGDPGHSWFRQLVGDGLAAVTDHGLRT